ncbi:unnamed protein product [Mytilus coruscus]|uniref:Endonuclease/exonuclease/phosphatase domain-containing protein n=1 Tax=Mytilus coruscus TaxID=42192 RepID=A0A6J8BEW9_MYTCO|nr:unnamed protein product [Mytilus coruscus]
MALNVSCKCNKNCSCFKSEQKCIGSCKCIDCKNQDHPHDPKACDLKMSIKTEKDQSDLDSASASGLQQQKDGNYDHGAKQKNMKPPLPTKSKKLSSSYPNLTEINESIDGSSKLFVDTHKIKRSRSLDMSIRTNIKYLTIMTINGSHGNKFKLDDEEKGQNMSSEKIELIKKAFNESDADIVCGQEFLEEQITSLLECLGEYEYTAKAERAERKCTGKAETGESTKCSKMFNVIFYKKSKFIVEPVEQEIINRAFTDDTKFDSVMNNDISRNRFHAAKIILTDHVQNDCKPLLSSFGIVSYHGFYRGFGEEARIELSGKYFEIFNVLSRKYLGKIPMIVCGDFNCDITRKEVSGKYMYIVCKYIKPIRRPNKFDFIAYNISPDPKHPNNNNILVKTCYNINFLKHVSEIKKDKAKKAVEKTNYLPKSDKYVAIYENRAIILDHNPVVTIFGFLHSLDKD